MLSAECETLLARRTMTEMTGVASQETLHSEKPWWASPYSFLNWIVPQGVPSMFFYPCQETCTLCRKTPLNGQPLLISNYILHCTDLLYRLAHMASLGWGGLVECYIGCYFLFVFCLFFFKISCQNDRLEFKITTVYKKSQQLSYKMFIIRMNRLLSLNTLFYFPDMFCVLDRLIFTWTGTFLI